DRRRAARDPVRRLGADRAARVVGVPPGDRRRDAARRRTARAARPVRRRAAVADRPAAGGGGHLAPAAAVYGVRASRGEWRERSRRRYQRDRSAATSARVSAALVS